MYWNKKKYIYIHRNHSISLHFLDKHIFCIVRRNSKWPPEVAGKLFLGKVTSRLCRYPVGKKFCRNCSVSEINPYLHLTKKFKMATKSEGKMISGKRPVESADTLRVKNFIKIALSRSVSEINFFLRFMQKFKMAAKSGRKMICGRSSQ